MKAYEATLVVNGKWKATMSGSNYSSLVDKLLGLVQYEEMHEPFVYPKEIKIEVKEI